jgi:hypothetical protein
MSGEPLFFTTQISIPEGMALRVFGKVIAETELDFSGRLRESLWPFTMS